uniref:Uncharacterized protein n=1 Tax=Trichogramma kaykai TaxID=54128 RepID=A0ABD2WBC5_9HYME
MKKHHEMFDTSDYKDGNRFDIKLNNKKVLGIMKDEGNGKIMKEFIGIRAKAYYCLYENSEEVKKAKGVKKSVAKNTITGDDYRSCLLENEIIQRHQYGIRSRMHILRTERVDKIALSPYDDKRYIIPGETATLPWGHYRIPCEEEGEQEGEGEEEEGEEEAVDEQNVKKRASNECRPPAVKRMRLEGEGGPIVAAPLDENTHPTLENFQTEEEGNDVHGGEQ